MDDISLQDLAEKVGGRFKLSVLIQKRLRELLKGSPRLIEMDAARPMDIAMREVQEGLIQLIPPSEVEEEGEEKSEEEEAATEKPGA